MARETTREERLLAALMTEAERQQSVGGGRIDKIDLFFRRYRESAPVKPELQTPDSNRPSCPAA